MSAYKTIIVEDEKPARDLLKVYLSEYPEVELIGEYDNGFDGLKAINETKPDAILLDVQMPKLTGFEMLEVLDHHPEVIFTTAYDQFAIRAFEQNAVDYLLKPFSRERFGEAIRKLISRLENHSDRANEKSGIEKINDINYLEAQDDYVMVYTDEGKYLKQQTMKYFENHLDKEQFVRVHRSYIANISSIERIEPYEKTNFVLILKDGNKVPVSRSGMQVLRDNLDF
jgi:two-component system LytT family response regulator